MRSVLVLALIAAAHTAPDATRPAAPDPRAAWRAIVAGEAGGGWPEGTRLVAWTMRAWELNLGYRPEQFGPRIGWYGWNDTPDRNAWAAVKDAYGADLAGAPFDWMRSGRWCRHLGSATDAARWQASGFVTRPADVVISHPAAPRYQLHCWWADDQS